MLTTQDFNKKQIVFVFSQNGEKVSFNNDNIVVKDSEEKTKIQTSCYRLFIVYIIGGCSLTTGIIQKAKKFGFYIALFTTGFHMYEMIGSKKDGNTILRMRQYNYDELDIGKLIIRNKIATELEYLVGIREKDIDTKERIIKIRSYYRMLDTKDNLNEIMAYEGLSSKLYFKDIFNNINWVGRRPRIKADYVNSTLDIGYTVLFSFVESILCAFGFDIYVGVLHRQFYMRKSLVCDIVEPFRSIIDKEIRKAINLGQIKEEDFVVLNNQYRLKYEKSANYVAFLMKPILENKDCIFLYVQSYYRAFMKGKGICDYPFYIKGEVIRYGSYKL